MQQLQESVEKLEKKILHEQKKEEVKVLIKEMKKIATIIAVESAKKIITQTIDKEKIDSINYASIQENLASLKKDI